MSVDGRKLAAERVELGGVGAQQRVDEVEAFPVPPEVYARVPGTDREDPTYYDRPLLKEPVWKPAVPAYFYFGGVGGAAGALAAALQVFGGKTELVEKLRWVNLVGTGIGTALLIEDLGRPERFLNMVRVFRPSSPMNVGSWILTFNGVQTAAAVALNRGPAWMRALAAAAGLKAGLFSAAQCAYPAVLLACTTVPVWQQARTSLPPLFVGSAMSSLGSLAPFLGLPPVVEHFGTLGKAVELVAMTAMERQTSRVERVGRPLRQGRSGAMWRLAGGLTAASLLLSLWPGTSAWKKRLAGVLGTVGAATIRFACTEAGKASSLDPKASFHSQRQGVF